MDLKHITKVSIKHGGEPLGGRVLNIDSSSGTILTPTRAPTSTEVNAKKRIHFDEPWDNAVFEVTNRYNFHQQIESLHTKNGTYASKRRAVTAQLDKFRGYALTKYFPQTPSDMRLDEKDIRILVELQIESGCDVISIPEPFPSCSNKEFSRNVEKFWEYIARGSKDLAPMPYLSLAQDADTFKSKLGFLSEHEHDLWAIGIRFASMQEYRPNLYTLSEFSDRDFWVHCSGGKRFHYKQPFGQLHALQRFGIDTVGVEVPQAPIQMNPVQREDGRNVTSVRYFDRATIMYPRLNEICKGNSALPCKCPLCKGHELDKLIADLRPLGPPDELVLRLNDASRIHEVYASTAEFEDARKNIKDGVLNEYFKRKDGLRSFIDAKGQQKLA
jgi:hypothetical protein